VSERETQTGDGEVGTCHVCGQTFSSQEELSKHLMEEHGEEGLPSEAKDDS
jgi:Zinc finger, C2H2 type